MMEFLRELLGHGTASIVIVIVLTLVAVVPLMACTIFLIDAIRLAAASRIVIKGKIRALPDYPFEVESVTECESQGLIRSNIARTTTSAAKYEPNVFKDGNSTAPVKGTYNYDESDGIPAVDRPLFRPKDNGDD